MPKLKALFASKKGSTLLIALCTLFFVITVGVSSITVAYSTIAQVNRKHTALNAKSLALSVSEMIRDDILNKKYDNDINGRLEKMKVLDQNTPLFTGTTNDITWALKDTELTFSSEIEFYCKEQSKNPKLDDLIKNPLLQVKIICTYNNFDSISYIEFTPDSENKGSWIFKGFTGGEVF